MNGLLRRGGFALPVVLISSVVMMTLLLISLTSISSIASSIQSQYYQKLADTAAEAGANFAKACLLSNSFTIPLNSGASLRPNTNCQGVEQVSCPNTSTDARCGVIVSQTLRTSFSVGTAEGSGNQRIITVTGSVQTLRKSDGIAVKTTEVVRRQTLVREIDPDATRAVQKYWVFGTAARLDFGTSGTTVTADSMPCSGTCTAGEGSTVVSKKDGTLQFWTDGRTMWDRNGTAMPNGSGLLANASTTQAAAIFPIDQNETRYVVVTNTAEHGYEVGELYYSIVDMSLRSGLGNVTTKNTQVWSGMSDYNAEALTAAPKSDGSGYWIITYSPYTTHIRVFSFNNATSSVDGVATYNAPGGITYYYAGGSAPIGFGSLNFNDSYTKLVMLAGNHCLGASCSYVNGLVRTMNFNPDNGVITNQNAWNNFSSTANSGYSADFSPSGNYVYTSTLYPARVYRYNVTSGNDATIKSSEQFVGNADQGTSGGPGQGGGQVLAAPDGRMYVADYGAGALSVINTPDNASPGWVYGGRPLASGKQSRYGLPQTVTVYTPRVISY